MVIPASCRERYPPLLLLDAPAVQAERGSMSLIFDSHIDIPWPNGPDPFGHTGRCVDFPKMRAGGMSAGCFVAYVPQTACDAEGHAAAQARAIAMLDEIGGMAGDKAGVLVRVTPLADQLEAAHAAGALAVVPAVENGHALGADLDMVDLFASKGARYLTLTHNGHNDLADAAIPRRDLNDDAQRHQGLSGFGRAVIERLNAAGMLVDVSHAAKSSMMQATEISTTPVVATHSCVASLCSHPRNLDDEQLDRLAASGGVIQITAMPYFLRQAGRISTVGIDALIDHVAYAVARMGIGHVGISSDFDGGGGIDGWRDASETSNVTGGLRARGFNESEIAALWGGNFLRLLRLAEQAAIRAAPTTAAPAVAARVAALPLPQ